MAAVCALAVIAADRTATTAAQPRGQAVAWAIFVDDLHADFRDTGRLRDLLRQLAKLVVEDDAVALATSGPSQGTRSRRRSATQRCRGRQVSQT